MFATFRLVLVSTLLFSAAAYPADVYVPDELQGWQAWVLEGKDYRDCPMYFRRGGSDRGDFVCTWPGTLDIVVDENGGRFTQQWTVSAEDAWLPLPGNTAYWPDQVTANGSPVAVLEHDGMPSVRVRPGSYRLRGRFEWDDRPGVLRVPPQSGLVALTVNGQRIARPEIDRNGVFLGERKRETQARDAVSVQLYRLVADNVPTRLVTQVQIDVSGSVREELFGPMLPDGFVPISIQSALPARLEADGQLRVQVRPGRWEVSLTARAPEVLNSIALPEAETNLPDSEIWSYRSNDRLRVTAAEGLPPVDPLRVQVPGAWSELPAFRISRGESLEITERSRGMAAADNNLGLGRKMWLDFDGGGFVVQDKVSGTMRTDWRLDMRPPFALKSATEGDESLLITNGDQEGHTGIEIRESGLDVVAIGRSETRAAMPVTGWDARFVDVDTVLYLPPGHKLLTAPGVDSANGSWVGQWQLLDFFLVLIITIAAWKLFGRTSGIIALLALTLSYHEINAPAWLWLNLLVAIALLRVAPAGKLLNSVRSYLGISALLLVFALVPFIAGQLRVAIYPQLEPQWNVLQYGETFDRGVVSAPASKAVEQDAPAAARRALEQQREVAMDRVESLEEIVVSGAKLRSANFARYAPNAIVQAGPGIPSWQWNAYRLSWSGPVDAEQTMRLVVLPRWVVTLARFAEVLLLLLFTAVFVAEVAKKPWTLPGGLNIGRSATACLLAGFMTVAMLASPQARAELPDRDMLQELEARLLQPPECVPRCAEIVAADVDIGDSTVSMRLTINALAEVAIPLPGSIRGWRPDAVVVEGSSSAQVLRGANQNLWLRVPVGRHSVSVRGSATAADSLEIAFPTPPRVIEVSGDGWFIAGIKDRRLLSGSLQLTRLQAEEGGDAAPRWESSRFPPFVHVSRTIELGLDWRVTTTVQRIAPTQGALTLQLPLIEGETVLTDNMSVDDGKILVSMNPTQRTLSWQSNLPRTSPLGLSSAAGVPWKETWYVGVGSVWHAEFSGVPESESSNQGASVRMAEFHPRGGESLQIIATRPEAAEGSTLAFDSVDVSIEQGARSRNTTLLLSYRSTRGAQHVITLPSGAEVTDVSIDGRHEPLRAEHGELTLPILPGEHAVEIKWREDGNVSSVTRTPEIDVAAAASNISSNLRLPENRWLLATTGPRLGPAVLYWSELAVLVLLALILGRIDWTPLKTQHWLLLGLGFSTFSWPVLGLVAVWILAVGARDKWRIDGPWWRYNIMQLGIVILTVVALSSIVASLPMGLLGTPDMHVTGNDSWGNYLSWFADRSESTIPVATAMSVPMWIYKGLILAWALWLSFALLKWLPWTWQCFARDGFFRSRKSDQANSTTGEA